MFQRFLLQYRPPWWDHFDAVADAPREWTFISKVRVNTFSSVKLASIMNAKPHKTTWWTSVSWTKLNQHLDEVVKEIQLYTQDYFFKKYCKFMCYIWPNCKSLSVQGEDWDTIHLRRSRWVAHLRVELCEWRQPLNARHDLLMSIGKTVCSAVNFLPDNTHRLFHFRPIVWPRSAFNRMMKRFSYSIRVSEQWEWTLHISRALTFHWSWVNSSYWGKKFCTNKYVLQIYYHHQV